MKRVRNLLLTALLVLMTVGCCALSACKNEEEPTNYKGLSFGKYYLENSDEVYIEIKDDHEAYLCGLDFSDFDPDEHWGHNLNWETGMISKDFVTGAMQGYRHYAYFVIPDSDYNLVFFEVKGEGEQIGTVYGISFVYNGTDELELDGVKYIKK